VRAGLAPGRGIFEWPNGITPAVLSSFDSLEPLPSPAYRITRLPGADSPPTGTTYSCVATYEGTNVEIIANEQGSFTTPSFVSFTDKERLIGEAAKNNAAMNPRNTVFDAK